MSSDKVSKDLPSFNKYIKQLRESDAQDGKIDGRRGNDNLFGNETLDALIEYDKKDDGEVNGSIFDGKETENKDFTDYIDKINETKVNADSGNSAFMPGARSSSMLPPMGANMSFADVEQYLNFLFDGGSIEGASPVSGTNAYTMLFSPKKLKKHGINGLSEGDEYFRGANYGQNPVITEDYTKDGGEEIFKGKYRVTSGFGMRKHPVKGGVRMHKGIDIALPQNTALKTPFKGVVRFAGKQNGYGNIVIIDHGNGKETRYAHLSKINVKPGQEVNAGELFAKSGGARGTTGAGTSTGAHLHFEYRENGKAKDPLKSEVAQYLV